MRHTGRSSFQGSLLAELRWSYTTGGQVKSSPAIAGDGTICYGSADRTLYALYADTPTPTVTPTSPRTPTPVATATPAATPNYIELSVRPSSSGGDAFYPGDQVVLEWKAHHEYYSYTNVPCAIYFGAARNAPEENTVLPVREIMSSGALYLFNRKLEPSSHTPGNVKPTWEAVFFPVPRGIGSSGSFSFTVPKGAAGRWVFATAFIRRDNGHFPADPPVEVSNGFTLY